MDQRVSITSYPGLDKRLSVIRLGDVVDAAFVRTERFNVLIDTLDTPEACESALKALEQAETSAPLIVINSHMDWDHFWGNGALAPQTMIIAHEAALDRFKTPEVKGRLDYKRASSTRFQGVKLVPPTVTFSHNAKLHGGDLTLQLLHTPGHTPDHVSIWIPELRVCLAGDAVEDPIPEVSSGNPNDLQSLISSLRRIQNLGAKHVILAHGQTSSPSIVGKNLRYFERIIGIAQSLSTSGITASAAAQSEGKRLIDLVRLPQRLTDRDRAFYQKFHETNLGAAMRYARQGV
jgi:glyoxylase-like metal-dependent hydrolase (beta-lactamase superfamily II)